MESMLCDVLQILKISCSGLITFLVIKEKISTAKITHQSCRLPVVLQVKKYLMVSLMLGVQGLGIVLFLADRDARRSIGQLGAPFAGAARTGIKATVKYHTDGK